MTTQLSFTSKFSLLLIFVPFLTLMSFLSANGQQWITNGPYGGPIDAIAVHPEDTNLVFAGINRGLLKSENGGGSWQETGVGDWIGDILFDPSDPQIVYVGGNSGFHKSFDGGQKWFTSGIQGVNDIAIAPSNPKIIYAATEDGLYQSPDGGGFWGRLGLQRAGSVALHPTSPDIIYVGTRNAGDWRPETGHEFHGAVYQSTDGGGSWSLVFNPGEGVGPGYFDGHVDAIVIDPKNPDIIYVGTRWGGGEADGLFKSTDGGKSWQKIWRPGEEQGPNISFILLDQRDTDKIFIGADGEGIYQSRDGGDTWQPFNQKPLNIEVRGIAIAPANPSVIYLATNWGVYKSADDGVTWAMKNRGITALSVRCVAGSPEATGVLYAGAGNGIHQSDDGGKTWRLTGLVGQEVTQILTNPSHQEMMYATGWTVYKSFDGGQSWWGTGRGFNGEAASIAIAPSQPNIIYGGSKHGDAYVYKSADSGASWHEMRVTDGANHQYWQVHSLAVDAANPNTVYAYMERADAGWGVYKSTDGGQSWKASRKNLGGGWQPQQLAAHPTAPGVVYLAVCSDNREGVNKSEDGGDTWEVIGLRGRDVQAITLAPDNPNVLYAASDGMVYQSKDGGTSWAELSVLDANIHSITPNPKSNGIIYAATDRGVYIYKASGDVTPPATPKDVQITLQGTTATVNWGANQEGDLAGYKVYYGVAPGAYDRPAGVKKETSYTVTGLTQDSVYYIAVSAYDTSQNESQPSQEVKLVVGEEPATLSFTMHLPSGISMISMPLKPATPYTARSLAQKLGATLIIEYDDATGAFFAYLPAVAVTDGFSIRGGRGYIVNLQANAEVTFTGAGWTNAAPALAQAEPAPPWAFGVGGLVAEDVAPPHQQVTVQIKNLRTGATRRSVVGSAGPGRFSTAFVDFSREAVVHPGDRLEISLRDAAEKRLGTYISMVLPEDIRNASLIVRLAGKTPVPSQTSLGQNFPNPFNPETWIPYQLTLAADVTISVYDVSGQLVRTLNLGRQAAGLYNERTRAAYWNGQNDQGERVASGAYLYVMTAGDFRAMRRMVVLK